MFKRLILAGCATAALTGHVIAQGAQPATPVQPAAPATVAPSSTPPSATTAPSSAPPAATTAAPATPAGPAGQPGIRTVDPTTVRMTFYTVGAADMLASNLMDMDVHNLQNEEIGEIEDLIVDEGKTIRGVVISVGGFLGIGERRVAVQPGSIVVTREGDDWKAVVNTTKDELQKAQEFKYEGNLRRE